MKAANGWKRISPNCAMMAFFWIWDQRLTRALADQMLLSGLLGEVVVTERAIHGYQPRR